MLHAVDSTKDCAEHSAEHSERRAWIGVLAKTELALLESCMSAVAVQPFSWLRRPETGLMMVRGRIGGTGDRFNFGEITVTRCALRTVHGQSGVAWIQGRSHRKAELAALADAMLQNPQAYETVRRVVLAPAQQAIEARADGMQRRAQATRVEFFTVAREAGA